MTTVTDTGLTIPQVARSAYAAYVAASQMAEAAAFDDLAEEAQAFWLRLAEQANSGLETHCDGKPAFEVAQWLAALADKQLVKGTQEAWVWEALARHLWFLLDAGDEEEPATMDGYWKTWVQEKLKQQPALAAQPENQ